MQSGGPLAIECAIYFSVVCTFVYNVVFDPPKEDGRVGSILLNANAYSLLLMIGVLFALRRLLLGAMRGRVGWRLTVGLMAFIGLSLHGIIVLTASRKGILLTIGAGVVLIVYWARHQSFRRRVLLSGACILAGVVLGYLLYRSPQFGAYRRFQPVPEGRQCRRYGVAQALPPHA